jgi:thioredoxin-dependent peroxiredoxin
MGAQIVGISADSIPSHYLFMENLGGLPFPLLSDIDRKVIELYGVLNDKGTGPRRSIFIVGRDGVVHYVNPKYQVNEPEHMEAVFQALAELKG